jgi:DNA (cytosine-5)-methyltransferase 1
MAQPLRYLSLCSGIEAATQAWHPMGWKPVAFSEIEAFPSAVLAHHYPHVQNWGDMTKFQEWPDADVDVLVGGTPCQSFSVAGLRQGLADPRGNLMLTYLAIAARYRPRWLVWENVPGVLSSNKGRDFGTFLGALGELGYGFAYRVLDAQYVRTRRFGRAVPQRRRRVFVVGYLGDWRRAAAVLFDRESLSGHPAPRREAGQGTAGGFECGPQGGGLTDVAPTLDTRCKDGPIRNQLGAGVLAQPVAGTMKSCAQSGGFSNSADHAAAGFMVPIFKQIQSNSGDVGYCLTASAQQSLDAETETETLIAVAHALRGEGLDASEDGTGRGTPIVPVAFRTAGDGAVYQEGDVTAPLTTATDPNAQVVAIQERAVSENPDAGPDGVGVRQDGASYTLEARSTVQAVAFTQNTRDEVRMIGGDGCVVGSLAAEAGMKQTPYLAMPWAVRRLTPRECERLQGFSDEFTKIPYRGKPADKCPDGPRYKALGNSMAVNAMEWIGERIAEVDQWGGYASTHLPTASTAV